MDSNQDNGGPAFPFGIRVDKHDTYGGGRYTVDDNEPGMTLRDYFAAKAMQGIVAACGDRDGGVAYDATTVAASAYEMADAMLKARSA